VIPEFLMPTDDRLFHTGTDAVFADNLEGPKAPASSVLQEGTRQPGATESISGTFVTPPHTQAQPVTDYLHGIAVTDPYRWLEDQESASTRAWVDAQQRYTRAYLDALPGRVQTRSQVERLLALKEVVSQPWHVGDRYYFLKQMPNMEQPAIVMKEGLDGKETVLVDPIVCASKTSIAAAIVAISANGRFLAYSVRSSGTDYAAINILELEQRKLLTDCLPEGYCTGIAFAPDDSGFYYSHRKVGDHQPNRRTVSWHEFGGTEFDDTIVFFTDEAPNSFVGILISPETNLLAYIVALSGRRRRTSLYLHEMSPGAAPKLLLHNIEGCFIPFFACSNLFAYTDLAATNFRIVSIDLARPDPNYWRDVVPESDRRIQQFSVVDDQIVVTRVYRFSTEVEAFRLDGSPGDNITVPSHGTVDLLQATNRTRDAFLAFSSISEPTTILRYDSPAKQLTEWEKARAPFDSSTIVSEELSYPSKDGTSIPLFLAARKDLLHSGSLPTFLTSYGGFGICVTPRFTAFATFLIEQGFLFAVPAIRGGSELGEEWHIAGRREQRQRSFDDFIAGAEWLLSEKRTAPSQLAIGGGSNAGLLVGAAITQRPDLFRAAICLGPLLDMARYHLFHDAGRWVDEYGSPEEAQDFQALLAYSPYHKIRDSAAYPAVLLISGDSDTRCNPMHARKMTARLQASSTSGHPILLQYSRPWGHTPVQPLSSKVDALADRLAFVCHELGVPVKTWRSH
jgi:prolyl oligopeptidase